MIGSPRTSYVAWTRRFRTALRFPRAFSLMPSSSCKSASDTSVKSLAASSSTSCTFVCADACFSSSSLSPACAPDPEAVGSRGLTSTADCTWLPPGRDGVGDLGGEATFFEWRRSRRTSLVKPSSFSSFATRLMTFLSCELWPRRAQLGHCGRSKTRESGSADSPCGTRSLVGATLRARSRATRGTACRTSYRHVDVTVTKWPRRVQHATVPRCGPFRFGAGLSAVVTRRASRVPVEGYCLPAPSSRKETLFVRQALRTRRVGVESLRRIYTRKSRKAIVGSSRRSSSDSLASYTDGRVRRAEQGERSAAAQHAEGGARSFDTG